MNGYRFSSHKSYITWLFCYKTKTLFIEHNISSYLNSGENRELSDILELSQCLLVE